MEFLNEDGSLLTGPTQIEIFEKLKFIIQVNEAIYFANFFWKAFQENLQNESKIAQKSDFEDFLDSIEDLSEIKCLLDDLENCMVFSRIAKFFLEYELDEIVRKKQENHKNIETITEQSLVFNELIIMS